MLAVAIFLFFGFISVVRAFAPVRKLTFARTNDAGVKAATAKESTSEHDSKLSRILQILEEQREEQVSLKKLVEDLKGELRIYLNKSINRMDGGLTRLLKVKLRDAAGIKFGKDSFKPFFAKSLLDLVYLASRSSRIAFDGFQLFEESRLADFAEKHFADFVAAYYHHLLDTVTEPSVLVEYPWVVNGVINPSHVRASERAELSHSQRAMLKRIECAADNASRGEDADLTRIDLILPYGPGLSTVVWMACGEFLGEMAMDCRGNVEILDNVVMIEGAELTMSPSEFGDAKKQLLRRFRVVTKCLEILHGIKPEKCMCTGRVFCYRSKVDDEDSAEEENQEISEFERLTTVKIYHHRV
eukprot:gene28258-34124_t